MAAANEATEDGSVLDVDGAGGAGGGRVAHAATASITAALAAFDAEILRARYQNPLFTALPCGTAAWAARNHAAAAAPMSRRSPLRDPS